MVRCCLESLALKYRWAIDRLETILGTTIKTIHVVGGGTKNALLCQFTADACGRPVHAGPVEATAIGNILMQALGGGQLGSVADVRAVVARSFPVTVYEPTRNLSLDRCRRPVRCLAAGLMAVRVCTDQWSRQRLSAMKAMRLRHMPGRYRPASPQRKPGRLAPEGKPGTRCRLELTPTALLRRNLRLQLIGLKHAQLA